MLRRSFVGLVCAVGVAFPCVASAQVELKNDGFKSGDPVGFQAGFVAGEMGAVRLVPTGTGPFRIHKVRLLFGGSTASKDVTLRIYADTGAAAPGTQLYEGGYSLTGSDVAIQEIDLTAQNVLVPGAFRVALEFSHAGVPSIARDDDGNIASNLNFIFASGVGWIQSNLAGLTGDWIIRADVSDTGGGGAADAGVPVDAMAGGPDAMMSVDAGASGPDAGSGDACMLNSDCTNGSYCGDDKTCKFDCRVSTDCTEGNTCDPVGRCVPEAGEDSGGCGCRTNTGTDASSLGLLMLGVLLALRRRRS